MSDSLYSDYINTRQRVDQLERIEKAATYLTLRRTTTQSLTTGGTLISWEDAVRNVGFTWSAGTSITIPQSGYYAIDITMSVGSNTSFSVDIMMSSIAVARLVNSQGSNTFRFVGIRQFTTSDVVEFRAIVGANRTLAVNAYGTLDESPFLHIVRIA
jgi:hypothetical protein